MRTLFAYLDALLRVRDWYPVKTAAAGVVGGFAVWTFLYFAAKSASFAFCLVLSMVVAIAVAILHAIRRPAPPPLDDEPNVESSPPNEDLYFLEYRLSWGTVERSRFEQRVRPLLTRLAEERLVQRHGIDRHREPERARVVVGEQLWVLMTGPADSEAKPPSSRQVSQWVDRIEAI
jgi:hypothetical protein